MGKKNKGGGSARRWNLFKANPHCHWCGRLTIWTSGGDILPYVTGVPVYAGGNLPGNAATVDHVVSRFMAKPGERRETVLACHSCNQHRGEAEIKGRRVEITLDKHGCPKYTYVHDPEIWAAVREHARRAAVANKQARVYGQQTG